MSPEEMPPELAALWPELRPEVLRQVALVERAVAALAAGALDDAGQQLARGEAHKLAGSIGSFGFDAAGRAARELELRFKAGAAQADAAELAALVRAITGELEPGAASGDATPAGAATAGATTSGGPPADSVDVVVVEDDEVLAQLALHALAARGWSTAWIADGAEALRQLGGEGEEPPRLHARLVLLDLELPGCSGLDVLRGLAGRGTLQRMRVVMLTGHVSGPAVRAALALGAHEHVAKPYTVRHLTTRVAAHLLR